MWDNFTDVHAFLNDVIFDDFSVPLKTSEGKFDEANYATENDFRNFTSDNGW